MGGAKSGKSIPPYIYIYIYSIYIYTYIYTIVYIYTYIYTIYVGTHTCTRLGGAKSGKSEEEANKGQCRKVNVCSVSMHTMHSEYVYYAQNVYAMLSEWRATEAAERCVPVDA